MQKGPGTEETERERHPAFGMISFSRQHGNPGVLFGSHLNNHAGTIRMTVGRACRDHHLSSDWYHREEELIEVELSFVQFSELLTSMNMGDGVPCTIRWQTPKAGNGPVPEIPDDLDTEQKKVADGFRKETSEFASKIRVQAKRVEEILAKKSLNKKDREEIQWAFGKVLQDVEANMPFVFDSFVKSTEKAAQSAKAEVEGFLTNALQRAGLEALKGHLLGMVDQNPALPPGDDSEK